MTTRTALLIQPNGDLDVREIDGLEDIYAAIGNEDLDWASPGPLNYICYGQALYELAYNPVATGLYRGTHPEVRDPLCGPILVFGPVKDEDETDVPEEVIRLAVEMRDEIGRDKIAELAVPLTDEQKHQIEMRMMASMDQADAALREGRPVDFGGIQIGRPGIADNGPVNLEEIDGLFSALFGEQIDGNRRQGRKP